jgi:hypothetical protein
MVSMRNAEQRASSEPDEVRAFPHGQAEILKLAEGDVGRFRCEAAQFHHHATGQLAIRMDDASELLAGPGDVTSLPWGHDAWVVGAVPGVTVDWVGASLYAM